MTRYIPKKIRIEIDKKHGRRCAFPGCKWPAVNLHHVKRFAYVRLHDANSILPLCKLHHEFAHLGLIKNEPLAPEQWKIRSIKKGPLQFGVDKKWQECRRKSAQMGRGRDIKG